MQFLLAAAAAAILLLSGCASIVSGANQSVSVDTPGCEAASCQLTNSKGTWFVKTPGSVTVHRAYGNLAVVCSKEGFGSASSSVASSTKGMAFGNLLFGGVIGAGVDIGTGAAYDYPNLISVPFACSPANTVAASGSSPNVAVGQPRSRLGIRVEDVSPALASSLRLPDAGGAVVTAVQPGSAAEAAGLKVGDVIREVNDIKLVDSADLAARLALVTGKDTIITKIVSNGVPATIQVRLAAAGEI